MKEIGCTIVNCKLMSVRFTLHNLIFMCEQPFKDKQADCNIKANQWVVLHANLSLMYATITSPLTIPHLFPFLCIRLIVPRAKQFLELLLLRNLDQSVKWTWSNIQWYPVWKWTFIPCFCKVNRCYPVSMQSCCVCISHILYCSLCS